jgi:hypothetical protein
MPKQTDFDFIEQLIQNNSSEEFQKRQQTGAAAVE